MQRFIEEIYAGNRWNFEMFGFDPDDCDDEARDSYIYAWFIKGQNKRYFYIGKGKCNRCKHIIREISVLEKNPKKYKGKPYKILQDEFGIDCEFLYENLTEKEAAILEAYCLVEYYKRKEPLLNVIMPAEIMENEDIIKYRDSYFYEQDTQKFLNYYR